MKDIAIRIPVKPNIDQIFDYKKQEILVIKVNNIYNLRNDLSIKLVK